MDRVVSKTQELETQGSGGAPQPAESTADASQVPKPCKIWTCDVCDRLERVCITTETDEWWPCGALAKSNVILEGKACWVDGTCDGEMSFDAQATSIFGGGLKSMNMVKHDRRRIWIAGFEAERDHDVSQLAGFSA